MGLDLSRTFKEKGLNEAEMKAEMKQRDSSRSFLFLFPKIPLLQFKPQKSQSNLQVSEAAQHRKKQFIIHGSANA